MTDNRFITLILALIVIATAPAATASASPFGSLGPGVGFGSGPALTNDQIASPRITLEGGHLDTGRWVKLSDCTHNPADDFWVPVAQSTCGDDPGIVTALVDENGDVSLMSYQAPIAP